MFVKDNTSDLFTRIRNASKNKYSSVSCNLTKLTKSFVDLLLKEGLIWGYKIQKDVNNSLKICILLKYINGVPVIRKIVWVSKPSKLTYVNSQTLYKHSPFVKGLYIFIISTDLGLMTDSDARRLNLGGKVLGLII